MGKINQLAAELKGFDREYLKLYQRVNTAARIVHVFSLCTLTLSIGAFLLGVLGYLIFSLKMEWGWGAWLLPLLLCWLPALIGGVFWYALDTLASIPKTMLSLKDRMGEKLPQNFKGLVKKDGDGRRKGLSSSVQLCWNTFMALGEVDDVILAISIVSFAMTPIGWIVVLFVLGWMVIGSFTIATLALLLPHL